MRNRNNNGVCRDKTRCFLVFAKAAVFIPGDITDDNAVILNFNGSLQIFKAYAVDFGVLHLTRRSRRRFGNGIHRYLFRAVTHSRARHIHGSVARADDSHTLAQIIYIRVIQIIDCIMHIAKSFAGNEQTLGPPCTCADENRVVTVVEQILQADRTAHRKVGPEQNSHFTHFDVIAV